jgi:hypothetical protein
MRAFSFGGGVQSMACLVLSAKGVLPYTHFIFANVGDDSENPATIEYVNTIARPYAIANGLIIIDVQKTTKAGIAPTIYETVMSDKSSIPIPMFMGKDAAPGSRNCTSDWKIVVIEKWMKNHGGATKKSRQPVGIGISLDEYQRMRSDDPEREPYLIKEYPLIDLRYTRADCQRIITEAGLPLAPKSSCWFCPFQKKHEWSKMRMESPALFDKAVAMEVHINNKRTLANKNAIYFTSGGRQLQNAIASPTQSMFNESEEDLFCDTGYCMT